MSLVLLRSQTDDRLVALARQGHERAFEAIVRRYRRPLLSTCRRIVSDALAEDVLQQALVSAWTALRRGDDVHDLHAWLFQIVRNTAISTLRRSGHDPPALLDALTAAPSSQEEAERRAVVHETLATIAQLPERQRTALLRIAVEGRSQDEVADELGVSRTAARALVHRARTTLRAAASAMVPLPVLTWLAAASTDAEPLNARIATLVGGAGGAGATATLLKAGAVAGVAAAVSAPMIADQHAPKSRPVAARVIHHASIPDSAAAAPTATAGAVPVRYPTPVAVHVRRQAGGGDHPSARDVEVSARHRGDGEKHDGDKPTGGHDDERERGDETSQVNSGNGDKGRRGDDGAHVGIAGGEDVSGSADSGRDRASVGGNRESAGDDDAPAGSGVGGYSNGGSGDGGGDRGDDGGGADPGSDLSEN